MSTVSCALGVTANTLCSTKPTSIEPRYLTDQKRIILFCDVERPLKSAFITRLNRWVSNNLVKATATQNFDGERVGIINKLFGGSTKLTLRANVSKKGIDRRMRSGSCYRHNDARVLPMRRTHQCASNLNLGDRMAAGPGIATDDRLD